MAMSQDAKPTIRFSWWAFLLLVILLSWPFQIRFVVKATTTLDKYLFSSLSMLMVTVATWIVGKVLFRDGFSHAGWSWGNPVYYFGVLAFALLVWLVPSLIEQIFGLHETVAQISVSAILLNFLIRFVATLLPGFGEEFGWRGYLLPHLSTRFGARKGLLLHAFIWWFWHLPVLVGIGIKTPILGDSNYLNVMGILMISIIPTMLHAIVFAFIWAKTKSIVVASVYHAAFDEVRDALETSVGFGPLVNNWQMIVIIITGGLLLWKADWDELLRIEPNAPRHLMTSKS
jgi:membrane protease YdiL (CAAX protease family)